MTTIHPALSPDNVAVITGAASGIGLAAARKFAKLGMSVALVDLDGEKLRAAQTEIAAEAKDGEAQIVSIPTDVSKLDELEGDCGQQVRLRRHGRPGHATPTSCPRRPPPHLAQSNLHQLLPGIGGAREHDGAAVQRRHVWSRYAPAMTQRATGPCGHPSLSHHGQAVGRAGAGQASPRSVDEGRG